MIVFNKGCRTLSIDCVKWNLAHQRWQAELARMCTLLNAGSWVVKYRFLKGLSRMMGNCAPWYAPINCQRSWPEIRG